MEQLLSDAHDRDGRPRILLLADLKRLQDWTELTEELTTRDTAGFALFLATDEPPDDAAFDSLVRWSIPHGIFSASFWGPRCEIAHDTFDEIEVILHIDSDAAPDDQPCVMDHLARRRVPRGSARLLLGVHHGGRGQGVRSPSDCPYSQH